MAKKKKRRQSNMQKRSGVSGAKSQKSENPFAEMVLEALENGTATYEVDGDIESVSWDDGFFGGGTSMSSLPKAVADKVRRYASDGLIPTVDYGDENDIVF